MKNMDLSGSPIADRAADVVLAASGMAILADFEHFAIGFSAMMAGTYYAIRAYYWVRKNGKVDDDSG